jgi:hypothetical protein
MCARSRRDVNTMCPVSASNRSFDNALPVRVIEIEIEHCDCGGTAAAIAVAPANTRSRVASRHWCARSYSESWPVVAAPERSVAVSWVRWYCCGFIASTTSGFLWYTCDTDAPWLSARSII